MNRTLPFVTLLALMAADPAGAQTPPAPAAPAAPPAAAVRNPMRFEWMREDPGCREKCREWIAAHGAIVPGTPADFAAFAKERPVRGAIVVLDSTGGSVLHGIELGREFRAQEIVTVVGRSLKEGERATVSPRAVCNSMCAFLLMGGVKRHVPADARVMVHQIWPLSQRDDATAATYTASQMVATQRMLGEVAKYLADMGADVELFRIATRIPPWESLRPLSGDELRRLRVHNADEVAALLPSAAPAPRPAPPAGAATAAATALGWKLIESGERRVLTRRHPLTIEGEQIGSFEITFRCGETPGALIAEYSERRRAGASDLKLDAVGISAERERAMLPIQSSKAGDPPSELVTSASGPVSAKLVGALTEAGGRSLVIATALSDKTRTTIRVGPAGLAEALPKLTEGCGR